MDASETGARLIENFEGYSFKAYWDKWGRVWTVGYGETNGVNRNTTMTRAQAESDLYNRLRTNYEPAINAIGGQHWNQNQFDGWCSIVWNLGTGSTHWDIGQYAQAGNWTACAHALLQYNHANNIVLPGLVTRRKDEAALLLKKPPPPPDPNHYLWYPDVNFKFASASIKVQGVMYRSAARKWDERDIVVEYDRYRLHPKQNEHVINQLRIGMMLCRNRVYNVAHFTKEPAWNDSRHLGWRYQQLDKRMNGELVVNRP